MNFSMQISDELDLQSEISNLKFYVDSR